MTNNSSIADKITKSLNLTEVPIGISFSNNLPSGIPAFTGLVAAGCEFWEKARSSSFYTTADDHSLCSIGIHTHNISGSAESQQTELMTTLEAMTGLGYVREDEIASIPVNASPSKYVIYGPLAEITEEIDIVVLFANSKQGLVLSEATQRIDKVMPPAMGRPACAAIPHAINENQATMSLGCCGARAYLDSLTENIALWALPADKIEQYANEIELLSGANNTLTSFHLQRRIDVQSGKTPTVSDSLAKL